MAQTYSEFKDYIQANLWRTNDTVLANNLDTIIAQADDELDKRTRSFQRRQETIVIAPESEDFDLTTEVPDFQAIISLTNNQRVSAGPEFKKTTQGHIYSLRTRSGSNHVMPYYSVDRAADSLILRLVGPFSATDPGDLTLFYRAGIPNYQSEDASWLEDEHLDLYLYTVLKHCAVFVREDDRVALYDGYADKAFGIADEDDKFNQVHGGTPLHMRPHRRVP